MSDIPRDDAAVYRWAALTLRVGAAVSFGTMLVGLLLWVVQGLPGNASSSASVPLDKLLSRLTVLAPLEVLNLGVLFLLITPAATLLSQVAAYTAARDWRFGAIALLVCLILLLGLALSILR